MTDGSDAVARLADTFRDIQHGRMTGVPVINPRLAVACVGFRPWQQMQLGVLLTPWFMNLVLLPGGDDDWASLRPGSKLTHRFPSGAYEFIVGDEARVGRYQACSLFSPVFEFEDQAAALATAEAVLAELMDEDNHAPSDIREADIARIWRGEPVSTEDADPAAADAAARPRAISRRDLLCGRLAPRDGA